MKHCFFVSIHAIKIAPNLCTDVNCPLGHYSFLLGSEECVLVILQNYVVYFAFFCSEKNVSEKEVA